MGHKNFLLAAVSAFAVTTCAAAAINFFIDPYGLFGSTRIEGLNAIKPASVTRMRLVKPYQVLRAEAKTLIAGNSRPEMGLDPESACWNSEFQPIYNLATPGSRVYLQVRYIQHALKAGTVRNIFLGIDFMAFLRKRKVENDVSAWPIYPMTFESRLVVNNDGSVNQSYLAQKSLDYLTGLFSLEAVENSIETLMARQDPDSLTRTERGFNPANEYLDIIRNEGQEVLFRHKNQQIIAEFSNPKLTLFEPNTNWSLQFESIERLLDLARAEGIHITLFINPYHAEFLMAIELGGKWALLEEWKRIMTRLTEQYDDVAIWDFNQFNAFTTERPPERGETATKLRWFWEPAHYSREMGDLMLAEMLDKDCGTMARQAIGSPLAGETIDRHLQELRTAMAQYKNDFPDVIDRLARIGRDPAPAPESN